MKTTTLFIWVFNFISMILNELYQHAGETILFAVLCLFCIQKIEEDGLKNTILKTLSRLKLDRVFRIEGYTALYVSFLALETVLGRKRLDDPLVNVIGNWSIKNFDNAENILLFVPFGILLYWHLKQRQGGGNIKIVGTTSFFAAITSISIELVQFVFSCGTFQLTDIAMNWLGGTIGSIGCLMIEKVRVKCEKRMGENLDAEKY